MISIEKTPNRVSFLLAFYAILRTYDIVFRQMHRGCYLQHERPLPRRRKVHFASSSYSDEIRSIPLLLLSARNPLRAALMPMASELRPRFLFLRRFVLLSWEQNVGAAVEKMEERTCARSFFRAPQTYGS